MRKERKEIYVYVAVSLPECWSKSEQKIENRSFENMSQFKYLGTTVTNQTVIQEIKGD
jgi:hypothetical protein